jgi:hypothetical protein
MKLGAYLLRGWAVEAKPGALQAPVTCQVVMSRPEGEEAAALVTHQFRNVVCVTITVQTTMYYRITIRGSVVVKALCYQPEGRGFDTRRGDF